MEATIKKQCHELPVVSLVGSSELLGCGRPYYQDAFVTLYNADAAELADKLPPVELVLTDPPYPNNAGHFDDGITAALRFLATYRCDHWMIFWHELETPPLNLPLVAKHVWHRNNSNRPDNYELVYEFHADGKKRASRVLPYPVIYPGLTGCNEATGHPTQKNLKLMQKLIHMAGAKTICDPFCGSGTTIEAARLMRRQVIGIEKNERWCEVTASRCAQETLALDEQPNSVLRGSG